MLIEWLGVFTVLSFIGTVLHFLWTPYVQDVSPYTERQRFGWPGWLLVMDIVTAFISASGVFMYVVIPALTVFGIGWLACRFVFRLFRAYIYPVAMTTETTEPQQTVQLQPTRPLKVAKLAKLRTAESTHALVTTRRPRVAVLPPLLPVDEQVLLDRDSASTVSSHSYTLDVVSTASDPSLSVDSAHEAAEREDAAERPQRPIVPTEPLFVPEPAGSGGREARLTVEDIYIEAMTLDAEIRVFRRRLNAAGRRELSRIIDFCRDALHRKLLLRSVEHARGAAGRSLSSENLSTPEVDAEPSRTAEVIAEAV